MERIDEHSMANPFISMRDAVGVRVSA